MHCKRITRKRLRKYMMRLMRSMPFCLALVVLSPEIFLANNKSGTKNPDGMTKRKLSIDLGGGRCTWADAVPAGENADIYGTLFASYPGGGMRATWQQAEGVSGIQVGDDFHLGGSGVRDK
eukprot:8711949-Ditylum_brightwellii.AAC.1